LLDPSPTPVAEAAGAPAPDALRALIHAAVHEALTTEFAQFLGAAPYERSAARQGVRNGYRERTLVTRVGALKLRVPRDRAGLFTPAVFDRYQRHEQALVATMAECYLQGVSTRKVRAVLETLCDVTVSASTVSAAVKRLDAALTAWRTRRLDAQAYPYLVVDAHYEQIRREGQVLATAVLWVLGVRADGYREHLGCWLGSAESAASWGAVFRDLAKRGLTGVRYVVSDEHSGLRAALRRHWPDAVHQRCQFHYLRNATAKLTTPAKQQALIAGLRDVWAAPDRATADARAAALIATWQQAVPPLGDWLDETLRETLGAYVLPEAEARRRLRTTNALEREHQEVRRRTAVIRLFPNEASYLRLATALAEQHSVDWSKRRYLIPDSPTVQLPKTEPYRRSA
jgi:transposase-like protein